MKLGIFGGTFNPIHYGHLSAAETVRERLELSRVFFVPAYAPPHKQEDLPSARHRMRMVELAIAGNPAFECSDIEVVRRGTSYTVDTVAAFRLRYPAAELFFITGIDSFLEIRTWREWERLLSLCAFVVISRPGFRFADLARLGFTDLSVVDLASLDEGARVQAVVKSGGLHVVLEAIPLYDISSTDIRNRLKARETVKYLLPAEVETYIIANTLYAKLS